TLQSASGIANSGNGASRELAGCRSKTVRTSSGTSFSDPSFIFLDTLVHLVSQGAHNLGPGANAFSNSCILAHGLNFVDPCISNVPLKIVLRYVEAVGERHYSCFFHCIRRQLLCAQGWFGNVQGSYCVHHRWSFFQAF